MKSLKELSNLIKHIEDERPNDDAGYELRHAAYLLQTKQFLYRKKARQRRYFDLVMRHQDYFVMLMDALNHDLEINEEYGYVGILPRVYASRMPLNSTLALLTLRYIYDQELMSFNSNEDGSVDITLEDFETQSFHFTGRELAKTPQELRRLLSDYVRVGVVDIVKDEDDPAIEYLKISPSVIALLSGDMLKRVEMYLKTDGVVTENEKEAEIQ